MNEVYENDNIKDFIYDNSIRLDLNNETEYMPIEEFSRWCALLQGVELILNKAEQLKINTTSSDSWIKPVYIEKFISEKSKEYIDELTYFAEHP